MHLSLVARRERGLTPVRPHERKEFAKAFGISIEEFDDEWRSLAKVPRSVSGLGIAVINVAAAGAIAENDEYGIDSGQGYEYIDRGSIGDDLAFGVKVDGDSMEPTLVKGDIVVFSPIKNVPRPSKPLKSGDIVYARFSADTEQEGGTIARWQETAPGEGVLVKDNPEYGVIIVKQGDLDQLAVAIERRTRSGL